MNNTTYIEDGHIVTGTWTHTAITRNDKKELIQILEKSKDDLDKNLFLYSTPLYHAISLNRIELVKVLLPLVCLDQQILVWPIDNRTFTPLEWSVFKKRQSISDLISLYKETLDGGMIYQHVMRYVFQNQSYIGKYLFNEIRSYLIE